MTGSGGNLGDMWVGIGADISNLDTQLAAAVTKVDSATQQIATDFEKVGASAGEIKLGDQLSRDFQTLGQEAGAFSRVVGEATQSVQGFAGVNIGNLVQQFEQLQPTIKDFGKDLMASGAAMSALSLPIAGIGLAALQTAGYFEQANVALTTMTGSAAVAKDMMAQLVELAIKSPFEIKGLVDASRELMAFGFNAQQVVPMLKTLGDATAMLGQGTDGLRRLALAFGEMEEMGTVHLRQLNQMAMMGVQGLQALAEHFGTTLDEMRKMITQGMIKSADAIPVLLESMNKKFGGGMEKLANTITGMWSNVMDNITKTLAAIGDQLAPTAKSFINVINDILGAVQRGAVAFAELPAPVRSFALALGAAVAVIGPLMVALGGLAFALGSISVPMLAIAAAATVAVAAIAGLVAAFHDLSPGSLGDSFRELAGQIAAVAPALRNTGDEAKAAQKDLGDLEGKVTSLHDVWVQIVNAFKSADWGQAFRAALGPLGQFGDAMRDLAELVATISGHWTTMDQAVQSTTKRLTDFTAQMMHNQLATAMADTTAKSYAQTVTDLAVQHAKLTQALRDAQNNFSMVSKAYKLGAASAADVAEAQKKLTAAMEAANPQWQKTGVLVGEANKQLAAARQYLSQVQEAYKLGAASAEDVARAQEKLTAMLQKQHPEWTATGNAIQKADEQTRAFNTDIAKAADIIRRMPESLSQLISMFGTLGQGEDLGKIVDASNKSIEQMHVELEKLKSDWDGINPKGLEYVKGLQFAIEYQKKLTDELQQMDEARAFEKMRDAAEGTAQFVQNILTYVKPLESILIADALRITEAKTAMEEFGVMTGDAFDQAIKKLNEKYDTFARLTTREKEIAGITLADELAAELSYWDKVMQAQQRAHKIIENEEYVHVAHLEQQLEDLRNAHISVWDDIATHLTLRFKEIAAHMEATFVNGFIEAISKAKNFGDFMQKVANAVVDAFSAMAQEVLKSILDDLIGRGISKLNSSLLNLVDTTKQAQSALKDTFGAGSSAVGAVGGAGGAAGSVGGSGGSSVLSGIEGMATAIGAVVSAISGIIQNIQLVHLSKVMGEVEVNTRRIDNAMNNADGVAATLHVIRDEISQLTDRFNDYAGMVNARLEDVQTLLGITITESLKTIEHSLDILTSAFRGDSPIYSIGLGMSDVARAIAQGLANLDDTFGRDFAILIDVLNGWFGKLVGGYPLGSAAPVAAPGPTSINVTINAAPDVKSIADALWQELLNRGLHL